MPFQPESPPLISGTISLTVTDPSLIAPTSIIESGVGCAINLAWTMTGTQVPVYVAAGGNFNPAVFLERQGPGAELAFPGAPVGVAAGVASGPPPTRSYTSTITIPAGVAPGIYRVVGVVTHVVSGLAAFVEGGILQVV